MVELDYGPENTASTSSTLALNSLGPKTDETGTGMGFGADPMMDTCVGAVAGA